MGGTHARTTGMSVKKTNNTHRPNDALSRGGVLQTPGDDGREPRRGVVRAPSHRPLISGPVAEAPADGPVVPHGAVLLPAGHRRENVAAVRCGAVRAGWGGGNIMTSWLVKARV